MEIKFSISEGKVKKKDFPHLLELTFTCIPQFPKNIFVTFLILLSLNEFELYTKKMEYPKGILLRNIEDCPVQQACFTGEQASSEK